jgi:CrcB protein
MKLLLFIGTGSFIGGILRYLLSFFITSRSNSSFPFGTFAVNIIGCLLIGLVFAISEKISLAQEWRLFLATGILGGFTTFSAFSNESLTLLRDGQFLIAGLYISLSVFVGIAATLIGYALIKLV